ncbi:MAG: IMP dehydrogenase [Chloroflexi bacterium GWB2_49_20]|nr:MAG: IMP dehydrogenase [Chloroflexi bacterium GWB2_49_20]OGN77947.1 MAG: IMP dehydrogenase [Chloroflexi bacterium GWC2_49_37]OGN84985.1 MAG: IMP dehydrogenase [Chloroflexi bacterium GWD2_49_16]HBG74986.1 IMP dehydrogenase [Anaerolineae bacterium]HCC79735.1 IMP dehydrogenase [Anaerolineae bacterium]
MNEELFESHDALTFDDVLVVPAYSEVLPNETDVSVNLTPQIRLNIPILSAAMDTVTEAHLAISLAREGGLGIIHRNMSPEDQASEVEKVKRSQSGMIVEPISLPPDASLRRAEEIMSTYHISGVPITNPDGKLVGILTNRDIRFVEPGDYDLPVSQFMTTEPLITARVGIPPEEAKNILQKHRIEKLPLVDENGILKGLITVKDIQKARDYPNAATDSQGRLLAGAAVGVGADLEMRVELMIKAGVDVLAIDTAHGHSKGVLDAIRRIKTAWPELPVIAGNVVTAEGTEALIKSGADGVKVGVGAGSICTTRVISGAGMPQVTAIRECAQAARKHGIPTIADGGIKFSGDIVKAIVAGAEAVMLGSLLAGLEESPGEMVLYEGRHFKEYRGMGSLGALKGYGKDRYGIGQSGSSKLVPEGIEGRVPYKGHLSDYVYQLVGGLRSGMGYAGAAALEDLRTKTKMTRITNAGLVESHPHDVIITREAPNYQLSQK